MKPSRGTALAALVLLAGAVPVTAYAVSAGTDDGVASHSKVGHGKGHDKQDKGAKHDDAEGEDEADEASGPGRAHAEAMKAWARCVAEAASGPKTGERTGPPKDACGEKPMGPGRAKHAGDGSKPGKSGEPHGQGKGHRH